MKLHERIRQIRTNNDMTLKGLSEITGLSISYLSDLERGRTNPSLNTLDTIAASFNMSVVELLSPVEFDESEAKGEIFERLPSGLKELAEDYELSPEWIAMLRKIELRGKRPESKDDWTMLYLQLKRILES